ncbi:glycosyl hydrolase [Arthrobacter livingstonensis]|uniref:Glycosyl hydrolase n=1 Tax=Arthrobacter livingstonensis TaxID=670078 RepID=A0A2V5LXH4_9MICC|nr:glycoside hydrolase family 3 N-terminal domain-containing protein [Arthrobacter livingstonensis]PYI68497.1 glycosyl hydrolase [Arthrobacter livingstonensis]
MTPRDHSPAPVVDPAGAAAPVSGPSAEQPPELSAGVPAELPRLVNSVIWPGFVGTTVPEWLDRALRNGLAGVVYFSHNIDPDAPEQVAALSAAIREANPSAVVGVDEEGGNVTRLQARDGSTIPGAAVLGTLDDPAVTAAAGRAIGRLCRAAGVNLAIAPVADVNTNPLNPVIGVRAFGSSTELVSVHTAAALAGIQSQRVGACAKHFPGHGDTVADSHLDVARVELTLEQLREHHLPPFQAAFDAGVAAVMSAHIIVPELGSAPATLNPRAGALLRDLGFEGLLITDALDMAAVRATVGPGEGAVLALLAGADLLCVGNPLNAYTSGLDDESCYAEVFGAVFDAVSSGRLPVSVLRRAAGRVAAFAQWSQGVPDDALADSAGGSDGLDSADWVDVAARACRVDRGSGAVSLGGPDAVVTLLDARTGHNMAAGPTENFIATALLEDYQVFVPAVSLLSPEDLSDLVSAAASRGESVLVIVDSLLSPDQQATLAAVAAVAPRALCINAGLAPAPGTATGTALTTIHCHGFSRVSAEAVVSLLTPGS